MKVKRIDYLDAIRGIAVWLVVLYHAYARYEHFPYGFEYASFPLLKYGYLGVELFFLISGFVILMTLDVAGVLLTFCINVGCGCFLQWQSLLCFSMWVIIYFVRNGSHITTSCLVLLLQNRTFIKNYCI